MIDLLYGSEFEPSVVPLQILGLMTLLYGINAYASVSLVARYRPLAYGRLLVPVIVLNVVLNLILIPAEGASGAAAAALASGALLAALALWQARAVLGPADLVGAFAGPVLGGAAMTGVVLALGAPWVLELVLGRGRLRVRAGRVRVARAARGRARLPQRAARVQIPSRSNHGLIWRSNGISARGP